MLLVINNLDEASELLKSEEERIKFSAEMKKLKTQHLAVVQNESVSLLRKAETIDTRIKSFETVSHSELVSLQEAEVVLQQVVEEKIRVTETREDGRSELTRKAVTRTAGVCLAIGLKRTRDSDM